VTKNKLGVLASCTLLGLGLAACGSSKSSTSSTGSSAKAGTASSITGAGSTLVAPLVETWAPEYQSKHGVAITYGAIGSGGGIAQITARTVDFGASDAPLSESQESAAKGVVEIPWALAATVIAYNVPGVGNELHLTGPVLAEIYLGKISKWNDPKIAALNPGMKLPSTKITPVYRTDASGDTFALTNYLSQISPEWKSKIGNSTQVHFPTGIGGKGNSGMGGALTSTEGSIAYIAIAYVLKNNFHYAVIKNAAGKYPKPGIPSIKAAAATLTTVPENKGVSIVNPPASAPEAYPISTFTYVLLPESSSKSTTLTEFVKWAITSGQSYGEKLEFAPLPEGIVKADEKDLEKIK
jgi:phosphate transport system substrate-binding protein